MAKGRIARPPIIQNLEIYHEFVCEQKTQAQIAAEFEISQPRVAAVCRKVERWVEAAVSTALEKAQSQLSAHNQRLKDGHKLHLAIAVRRLELKRAYGKCLDQFGGPEVVFTFLPLLGLWDAGAVPDTLAALLPPREMIRSALHMATEITELESLAKRGPYPDLPAEPLGAPAAQNPPSPAPAVCSPVVISAPAPV